MSNTQGGKKGECKWVCGILDVDEEVLIIMPTDVAERNALIHRIVGEAEEKHLTWREVKKLLPKDVFEEAWEYVEAESEDTRFEVGAYFDGDWPPHPFQNMEEWLPLAITEKYGQSHESAISGSLMNFSPVDLEAILKKMKALGMSCRRDDKLICAACGC